MRFRTMLVPAVALLALTSFAQAPQGATELPNLVTVTGNAESKADPDLATIRVGVTTNAKTAKEAQLANSVAAAKIIDAALKIAGDKKNIQTSDLSLNPQYQQNPTTFKTTILGYTASNIVTVRLEDVTKVGPLVDAVTDAGATNIDSIAFGLKDEKKARLQLLKDAVKDAQEKALALVAGLNRELGTVYSIEEGGGISVVPYRMPMAMARAADTPVMPGQVSLTGTVTVRFRIVP